MDNLLDQKQNFSKMFYARYATDITLRQCIEPGGIEHKVDLYFNVKYKL